MTPYPLRFFFFFFNDTATTEIYTLSLHDALPICGFQFIHFRRRLPEEEIRGDRRPQHRDERHDEVLRQRHVWNEGRLHHGRQLRMRKERGDDIRKERQGQPLEDLEDGRVADEELQTQDQCGDGNDEPDRLDQSAGKQLAAGRHRAEVGANVEGVGGQQTGNGEADQPAWELAPQADAQAHAGLQRDSRAQLLDRAHEWKRQEGRPEEPIAEVAADLRVGSNAARIVIAGPGDQAGSQQLEPPNWTLAARLVERRPPGIGRPPGGKARRRAVLFGQLLPRGFWDWLDPGPQRVLDVARWAPLLPSSFPAEHLVPYYDSVTAAL